jgi:hypothetical protein
MTLMTKTKKTNRGRTYQEEMKNIESGVLRCEDTLRKYVNYAYAITSNPEVFGCTAGLIADMVKYRMDSYRIILNPFRYISEEGLLEVLRAHSDGGEVSRIIKQAQEFKPTKMTIDKVINEAVFAIIGLQDMMECMYALNKRLENSRYVENESILETNEPYEYSFLRENGVSGGLFFSSGGLSNATIDIKKSNFKFANVPDQGYLTFNVATTEGEHRLPNISEVYCDGKFTGPCQLSIRGVFYVMNDEVFKGTGFKEGIWKLSKDKTWGGKLISHADLNSRYIVVHYCQLFPDGIYDIDQYIREFTVKTRESLIEGGVRVAW